MVVRICSISMHLCDQGPRKARTTKNLTRFSGNKWDGTAAVVSPCVCPKMEVYFQMAISIGNLIKRNGKLSENDDLSAYARQPARGPTMLVHFVAMLAYVGLSCGQCEPISCLMLTHVEAKEPKNGNSKKYTVKRMIF